MLKAQDTELPQLEVVVYWPSRGIQMVPQISTSRDDVVLGLRCLRTTILAWLALWDGLFHFPFDLV